MRVKSAVASAIDRVVVGDYTVILEMKESVTLAGMQAGWRVHHDAVMDAKSVVISFVNGGFGRIARELDSMGIEAEHYALQRRVPVAWVVSSRVQRMARHQAYRFATWGLLRGVFVEYESALAWLKQELPAGPPAIR